MSYASYINEIKWQGSDSLEDLASIVRAIKAVAEVIDDKAATGEPSTDIFPLNMIVLNMLEGVYRCLYRFVDERGRKTTESPETST